MQVLGVAFWLLLISKYVHVWVYVMCVKKICETEDSEDNQFYQSRAWFLSDSLHLALKHFSLRHIIYPFGGQRHHKAYWHTYCFSLLCTSTSISEYDQICVLISLFYFSVQGAALWSLRGGLHSKTFRCTWAGEPVELGVEKLRAWKVW